MQVTDKIQNLQRIEGNLKARIFKLRHGNDLTKGPEISDLELRLTETKQRLHRLRMQQRYAVN